METTFKVIDALLYILIYGFSCLFILAFVLEMQVAFINHVSGHLQPQKSTVELEIKSENKSEFQPNLLPESNLQPVKPLPKSKNVQLRKLCDKAGIDWYYTSVNPKTNRKRHMTITEMEAALSTNQINIAV
ncbi:hypothetical protein WA1_51385 [Scytonema hofmannii PCC 7110]|uniref:Uncharacterized protein n=1 Tax=Scytonema hofmannii PCC 7110 TaxID=128403 RepID=A0A139WQ96_9CYAN|nr:hypothetical protein [Scytonema hofmannii]KYC34602.1 hypothetical protein WA1_51385 [Scytonema hofmannii PCC 7110]